MQKKSFPPILLGNWKMNQTKAEIEKFFKLFLSAINNKNSLVGFAPPSVYIDFVKTLLNHCEEKIFLGSQNLHWQEKGAFTGEISPLMLKDLNVDFSIIGHSERRTNFNETNETVNLKTISALNNNLTAIVCVGESLADYKALKSEKIVLEQLEASLKNIVKLQNQKTYLPDLMVAYEPIWAIGTGVSASPEDANKICSIIKEYLYNKTSQDIPVLYGGSTDSNNIESLYQTSSIDGFLVGNSSLKPEVFSQMIKILS